MGRVVLIYHCILVALINTIITRNLLRGRFVSGVQIINVAVIRREGNREV